MWMLVIVATIGTITTTMPSLEECEEEFRYDPSYGQIKEAYCINSEREKVYIVPPKR